MRTGRPLRSALHHVLLPGLLLVGLPAVATAATVRGRLERVMPNGSRSPAAGIAVTVSSSPGGRSKPAFSLADGLYYIYGVAPGSCILEVWVSHDPGVPPSKYRIQVTDPLTDLRPIVVP